MQTKEEDIVEHLFVASAHSYVLVFTDKGRLYWIKVHQIPEVGANARGKAIVNLLTVEPGENVRALLTTKDFPAGKFVVMVTRAGRIKKTELTAFSNVRTTGIIAIDINEGDDLYAVRLSEGNNEIFIGTHDGMAIRFHEADVRPMGRGAAGVKAISLRRDDHVIELDILPESPEGRARAEKKAAAAALGVEGETDEAVDTIEPLVDAAEPETEEAEVAEVAEGSEDETIGQILTITEKGFGKRTPIASYRLTNRGAQGVTNIKTTDKNGKVAGIAYVFSDDQILLITEQGMIIRVACSGIRSVGRSTQGVRIINIDEDDVVVGAVKVFDREQPEDENGEEVEGDETSEPADTTPSDDEPIH
jgi:DNA gyrase subunit A